MNYVKILSMDASSWHLSILKNLKCVVLTGIAIVTLLSEGSQAARIRCGANWMQFRVMRSFSIRTTPIEPTVELVRKQRMEPFLLADNWADSSNKGSCGWASALNNLQLAILSLGYDPLISDHLSQLIQDINSRNLSSPRGNATIMRADYVVERYQYLLDRIAIVRPDLKGAFLIDSSTCTFIYNNHELAAGLYFDVEIDRPELITLKDCIIPASLPINALDVNQFYLGLRSKTRRENLVSDLEKKDRVPVMVTLYSGFYHHYSRECHAVDGREDCREVHFGPGTPQFRGAHAISGSSYSMTDSNFLTRIGSVYRKECDPWCVLPLLMGQSQKPVVVAGRFIELPGYPLPGEDEEHFTAYGCNQAILYARPCNKSSLARLEDSAAGGSNTSEVSSLSQGSSFSQNLDVFTVHSSSETQAGSGALCRAWNFFREALFREVEPSESESSQEHSEIEYSPFVYVNGCDLGTSPVEEEVGSNDDPNKVDSVTETAEETVKNLTFFMFDQY